MELVVDASAFVKLLVEEAGSQRVATVASAGAPLFAPDWLLIESAMALWKRVRREFMSTEDALEALEIAERWDVTLVPAEDLLLQALALACELPHPVYDCLYVTLALHGGRTLVTADARMREVAEAVGVRVEWVGD